MAADATRIRILLIKSDKRGLEVQPFDSLSEALEELIYSPCDDWLIIGAADDYPQILKRKETRRGCQG